MYMSLYQKKKIYTSTEYWLTVEASRIFVMIPNSPAINVNVFDLTCGFKETLFVHEQRTMSRYENISAFHQNNNSNIPYKHPPKFNPNTCILQKIRQFWPLQVS